MFAFVYGPPDVLTKALVKDNLLTPCIKDAVVLATYSDEEGGAVTADWVEVVYANTLEVSDTRTDLLVVVLARDLELRHEDYVDRCQTLQDEIVEGLPASVTVTCRLVLATLAETHGRGKKR